MYFQTLFSSGAEICETLIAELLNELKYKLIERSWTKAGICSRTVQSKSGARGVGIPPFAYKYAIHNGRLYIRFSADCANPRDEICEPRRETRPDIRRRITAARVGARIKAKNGRVIRKGLCDPCENAELPRVLHARMTPLLVSHFTRITRHHEFRPLLMRF